MPLLTVLLGELLLLLLVKLRGTAGRLHFWRLQFWSEILLKVDFRLFSDWYRLGLVFAVI